ncbi:MAG: hypothetical protein H0V39_05990 [Nitrosomonas sp.]|nr:hypothetical protein [Nitrosomonas sp.]
MNRIISLGMSSAAAIMVAVFPSPTFANELSEFSSIAQIKNNNINAIVNSDEMIEESGAYGYGVITKAGLNGILVTTTHGGVLDSAMQTDASDARFHNHYLSLQDSKKDGSGLCPTFEVKDISWDAPGDVTVLEDTAVFDGPTKYKSTHSLTGKEVSFRNLGPIGSVVSFTITPVDGKGNFSVDPIDAVCIDAAGTAVPLVDRSPKVNQLPKVAKPPKTDKTQKDD